MGDLYALDFDGVLCDSCGESYATAAKAAKVIWPTLFNDVDSSLEDWVVDQIRIVRPVLQNRYDNLLLVRLLLEMRIPSIRKSSVAEGLTVEGIVENWLGLKNLILKEWGEDKDALVKLYFQVRNEWKVQDLKTWIGANRLYPGVADALKSATSIIYIVTGKQSPFAEVILQEFAKDTIPPERIFGVASCSHKIEILKQLQEKAEHQGLKLHFVEDRLATLKEAITEPELDGWNLYLSGWGYNTQKEKDEAATIPRIQILQLSDFNTKLKLYPGVADALTLATSTIYIVTGKQSRFAKVILKRLAEVTLPHGRIFGDGSRSSRKIEVLKQLQEKSEHQGLKLHFVEDRLATLKEVIEVPKLDGWNLYLGGWAYNTQNRDVAATIPRIQILQLFDFSNKLK